jgi:esterase FrsA
MNHNRSCSTLSITSSLELYHTGPCLDSGPLPTLFYFALSGPDSLCTDPYNQPVRFLGNRQIRIFSLTLPAHEQNLSPLSAIGTWAQEMAQGKDPLDIFLTQAQEALAYVLKQKLAHPDKIAVAGLSRGGLIAALFAAREARIRTVLGFAPITRLSKAKEFKSLAHHPLVTHYDLFRYSPLLAEKRLRFYIGNRDERVGTKTCFDCIESIVEEAHQKRIRSPQIELIISPSIGHMGHGTPPEVFKSGAEWLAEHLHLA